MRLFYFLISFIIISSCHHKNEMNVINKYLEQDLNITLENGELYILFPTYGECGTSQKRTREYLLTHKGVHKQIHLIYIGNSKKELQFLSKGLDNSYDVNYDPNNTGVKKGVVNFNSIVFIPLIEGNIQYELTSIENFDKMKSDVSNIIND